jgi:RNA polymerase sigma factor (sigma-70 family)
MKPKSTPPLAKFASDAAEHYSAELHRFLARRLHRPDEVEDLVQEVYIRLLKIDNGEFVLNPRGYILKTAANVAHDYVEKDRRAKEHVVVNSEVADQSAENPPEHLTCSLAQQLNSQQQLSVALAKLAPIHASVLLMHYREGYSYEEIAERLKVSVRQVERYLANAKQEIMAIDWKWD